MKARKDMKWYSRRTKIVSEKEIQRVEKERKEGEALMFMHNFKSQNFLE